MRLGHPIQYISHTDLPVSIEKANSFSQPPLAKILQYGPPKFFTSTTAFLLSPEREAQNEAIVLDSLGHLFYVTVERHLSSDLDGYTKFNPASFTAVFLGVLPLLTSQLLDLHEFQCRLCLGELGSQKSPRAVSITNLVKICFSKETRNQSEKLTSSSEKRIYIPQIIEWMPFLPQTISDTQPPLDLWLPSYRTDNSFLLETWSLELKLWP
ncbi:hypothetical protein CDAR_401471 [Caerostris darwini]|uniref:Uncharacterized protein n=1 Tax=Caerostris darwini TaxID=1538125 RepID=A0AAV4TZG4_9ARAC|nr:hypothetical protein CDAR_401431 [Caerostris darwini]GIY50992.1 hypothetical protein CDAR_401471 [Caerostris darwini]